MIGYAMCGSFCTHARSLAVLRTLVSSGYAVVPILSECAYGTDTRFGTAEALRQKMTALCGHDILHTVRQAEPIGPSKMLSLLVVAPCTGNTLAKVACGITDSCVTMAIKAQLRHDGPVLLALASNDALSANLKNLAALSQHRRITFVPPERDDPEQKPYSLISRFEEIPRLVEALAGPPCPVPLM